MNNDRELLELAAKAVGIDYYHQDSFGNIHEKKGGTWNPLTDDGDALRLAVKLDIDIELKDAGVWANAVFTQNHQLFEWHNDDSYVATRRAIVRAAAEIGKGMEWSR